MGIASAMRGGWRFMPDRTTVSFRQQTSPGVYTATTTNNCWRRSSGARGQFVGLTEAENSGGVYRFQQCMWFIPREMRSTQPGPSDIIRLAATTDTRSTFYGLEGDYIILSTDEVGALGCWRCNTVIPFLQGGLTDTISIYRPVYGLGDGGRNVETSRTTIASGVSAKIQNMPPNTAEEAFGKQQIATGSQCHLSASVDVQAHDILIDDVRGIQYTVKSENRTDMLGVLQGLGIEFYL